MDPRTLVLLMIVSGCECSLLFFAAGALRRKTPNWDRPPSLFWGLGTAVNVLGVLFLFLQGRITPWIGIVLSNATLVLGQFLILIGVRRVAGRPLLLGLHAAVWILDVLLVAVFTFLFPSTQARVVLFSCVLSLSYIEGAAALLGEKPRTPGPLAPVIAVTFLLLSAFFLGRALVFVLQPRASILTPDAVNTATFLVSHVALVAWSLGLILLQNRKTERDLERAYAEKEVLFRELQHRVKNSLSVIIGLVGLESSRIEDPRMRSVLESLRGRIDAVAVLYDRLFRSGETEEVDLDLYLKNVAESLFSGHAAEEKRVSLETSLEGVRIDPKRAIPLGIIVNELLTDCLKYAFPEGRGGTVRLSLEAEGADLVLEVRDDGVGLPPGFSLESSDGFGLVLVDMLSRQVGGSLSLPPVAAGTRFMVRFPRAGTG